MLSHAAVLPLETLDPAAGDGDLAWLDRAVGDARVVALGESAHYNHESLLLRHRLLRYLVERHGFRAYAMESGFAEGRRTDDWVRGGGDPLGDVQANGLTSLMGLWTEIRAQLEWLREHNASAAEPVGFAGIDLPGSMVSLLPGLEAVLAYLARADPGYTGGQALREAAAFAAPSAFSAPAAMAGYQALPEATRDALTAGLADLTERLRSRPADSDDYDRVRRILETTVVLDGLARSMARGDHEAMMRDRDAAMADTVEWVLGRAGRVVVAAHNGHILRCPVALPGLPPLTMMGAHLAGRLGAGYLSIGTTTGSGWTLNTGPGFYAGELFTEQGPPEPGSLDALLAASHDGPFAVDLRTLSPADAAALAGASRQRFGPHYSELNACDAYDVLVHLPRVTPAEPDKDALAYAPAEVREAFARLVAG